MRENKNTSLILDTGWIITFFLSILVFIVWLVSQYAKKSTKLHVKFLTIISWFFCFGSYAVLPIDIYLTLNYREHPVRSVIGFTWNLIYWGNFLMCWLILPLVMEYEDAGDFTPVANFKRSVMTNLKYYGVFGITIIPIITVVYVYGGLKEVNFKEFISATANSFGVFVMIICLGYSLTGVPQSLNLEKDLASELGTYQYEVSYCNYIISKLIDLIETEVERLASVKFGKREDKGMAKYIDLIINGIPSDIFSISEKGLKRLASRKKTKPVSCFEELVQINKKIKKYVDDIERLRTKESILRRKALFIEDLMDSKFMLGKNFYNMNTFGGSSNKSLMKDINFKYHISVKPILYKILFILSLIFSFFVLTAEVIGMVNKNFENFLRNFLVEHNGYFFKLVSILLFFYTILCVHFAIFRFKIAGFYNLYQGKQTDPSSLLYSGINFSRVSASICLNFLQILNVEDSSFNEIMGSNKIVPIFGESFQKFFPMCLVFLVLFNMTDVYGKVMKALGLQQWDFGADISENLQNEGKKILLKARLEEERQLKNLGNLKLNLKSMFSVENAMSMIKDNSASRHSDKRFFV